MNKRLVDGRQFRSAVEPEDAKSTILDLAARVYEGLSEREVEEIEAIALHRRAFFRGGASRFHHPKTLMDTDILSTF